jgi:intein-encoded DNA endonuclease-like protein
MAISLDYIAGLFDGEGSIIVRFKRDRRYRAGYQLVIKITLHQKQRDVLEIIMKKLNIDAHIYYHKRDKLWYLEIYKIHDIEKFALLIGSRSFIKKDSFEKLIKIISMVKKKLHLSPRGIERIMVAWHAPVTAANPR